MSSMASASERAAAGVPKRMTGVPIMSAAVQRNTLSAAGLRSTIRPSWSVTMIGSSADSMMAESRASLSRTACCAWWSSVTSWAVEQAPVKCPGPARPGPRREDAHDRQPARALPHGLVVADREMAHDDARGIDQRHPAVAVDAPVAEGAVLREELLQPVGEVRHLPVQHALAGGAGQR